MRTDKQRDMKKLMDGFCNFVKAPENVCTINNYGYTTCHSAHLKYQIMAINIPL
jgi:hypothetical protein